MKKKAERTSSNHSRAWLNAGLVFLLLAVLLVGYNQYDAARAGSAAQNAVAILDQRIEDEVAAFQNLPQSDMMVADYQLDRTRAMPVVEIDGHYYVGTIALPTLDLELPVMDEWSYENLKIAPCRYHGTAYLDGFSIAAHNYTRHFGRLKNLQPGDSVVFTDADGNVFKYLVSMTETLKPSDAESVVYTDWPLTLFTCTLGGRTRVTVRCERDPDQDNPMAWLFDMEKDGRDKTSAQAPTAELVD